MSVVLQGPMRPKVGMKPGKPSIREVCLLGTADEAWDAGERVTWSGRTYQVVTTQERTGGEIVRYVHLTSPGSA